MNQSISNLSPEDKYKSVTIDFLHSIPELDVDNNKNHLSLTAFSHSIVATIWLLNEILLHEVNIYFVF